MDAASSRTTSPLRVRWSGLTDTGRFRSNNEDAFLALNFDRHECRYLGKYGEASMEQGDFIFAVSDGMGGAQSGEFASRLAVDTITRLLPPRFRDRAMLSDAGLTEIMHMLFEQIHQAMTQLGRHYDECAGMGATLTLCWVTPEWIYFGHIGDSRLYYYPAHSHTPDHTHQPDTPSPSRQPSRQVSEDHSYVGWLQREGKINEREARQHPQRHALNQSLGGGQQFLRPHIGRISCHSGDRFLLCSDGLISGLWDQRIETLARQRSNEVMGLPTGQLVREAIENCGRDNTTALMFELGD